MGCASHLDETHRWQQGNQLSFGASPRKICIVLSKSLDNSAPAARRAPCPTPLHHALYIHTMGLQASKDSGADALYPSHQESTRGTVRRGRDASRRRVRVHNVRYDWPDDRVQQLVAHCCVPAVRLEPVGVVGRGQEP